MRGAGRQCRYGRGLLAGALSQSSITADHMSSLARISTMQPSSRLGVVLRFLASRSSRL
jgi:hypothetical protein